MTDCKRCGITIFFENAKCFDGDDKPHDIRNCNTIPMHVWCPIHRESFSQRNPCSHYIQYGYTSGQNESFIIDLILQNYSEGDWFTRRNKFKKSNNSMKKSVCTKCNVPVHNMSKKQQLLHEKIHLNQKNQNVLSEFF